jgi:hypothetical protein
MNPNPASRARQGTVILLLPALLLVPLTAFGQKDNKAPKAAGKVQAPKQQVLPQGSATVPPIARPKAPPQIPDAQINLLMNMTPEEREKLLSRVPPDRRESISQRLQRLDQLPPEQKAQLNWRFQEFQKLSPLRQRAIRAEMQTLKDLRQPQRRLRIQSPEFREQYSPEEIRLMKDVWNIP